MTREEALRRALREALEEWRHQELPPRMVPRDGVDEIIPREGGEARALVGPRRVGKTYAMYQAVKTLENQGVPRTRIVYIDFEDPRLTGMRPRDVGVLIRVLEEYSGGPRPLLFLDEVQALEGWGGLVRVLHTGGTVSASRAPPPSCWPGRLRPPSGGATAPLSSWASPSESF